LKCLLQGVLIKTAPGTTKQVIERLRQTEEVSYDIVTMIKDVKDLDDAGRFITEKVAKIDGITSTETLIAANI